MGERDIEPPKQETLYARICKLEHELDRVNKLLGERVLVIAKATEELGDFVGLKVRVLSGVTAPPGPR